MTVAFLFAYALLTNAGRVDDAAAATTAFLAARPIDFVLVLTSLVIAPLLETCLLLGLALVIRKMTSGGRDHVGLLFAGGLVIGLLVHGFSVANMGRAAAFALLALLFRRSRAPTARAGYVDAVLAHAGWNLISLLLMRLSASLAT